MMDWITQYWIEFLFGLIIILLTAGYRKLNNLILDRIKRDDAIELGMQAILRDRVIEIYNHYMDKGFYPIYARENTEELFKQYHTLGGNGTVTKLVDELNELPTEPNKMINT